MAIRKDLVWRVADDLSISPSTPQNGGVQGEDKAVRVKFILGTEHPLVKGEYQLYIECEDPTGGYDKTEVLTPDEEGAIAAEVPLAWTQYGGTVSLYVVAEGEQERILTDPASMSFRNRNGVLKRMQALIQTYIQKLLNRAEKALDSADELTKTAEDAVETATTGAESAAESAGSAAISAQGAQMAAQTATASAGEATSAATAASLARSAAENAARNAKASADTAEQARQNAAGAVGKCSEYAMRAEESADTAEQAAKEMTEVVENGGLTFFVKDDGEGNLTFLGEGDVALAPLVVTCKDGETASHTANEIYEHIQDGGSVVLSLDGLGIAALSACTPYLASFTIVYADEGNVLYTIISVDTNKNASWVELAGDQLIVTVDVDTMTASHTPAEMLEQIAGGSNVAIKLGDDFCALSACTAEAASFVIVFSTDEGVGIGAISIDANRAVTLKELGGGGGITVDDALDENSTNPLQNKVVYEALFGVGQTASQAYNTAESASMAANDAKTIANTADKKATTAINTANTAKFSAEAAELKALQAQNAVNELNTAMSSVQEWQGVVENMAAELSESVSRIDGVAEAALAKIPDAADAPFDGFAVVTKGGKWVLSDAPVATKSDLASINGPLDHLDGLVEELETKVYNIGPLVANTQSGVSAAHVRIGELESSFSSFQAEVNAYVGDLDTALDAILAIQKELIGVTLITFSTPTGAYQAEEGMTWGEWISSEYNVDGFIVNNDGWIEDGDGGLIYDAADGGEPEKSDYIIIANHEYIYD